MDPKDRDKLINLLRRAEGSTYENEVRTALEKGIKILRDYGLNLSEIVNAGLNDTGGNYSEEDLLDTIDVLNTRMAEWEDIVNSLSARNQELEEKNEELRLKWVFFNTLGEPAASRTIEGAENAISNMRQHFEGWKAHYDDFIEKMLVTMESLESEVEEWKKVAGDVRLLNMTPQEMLDRIAELEGALSKYLALNLTPDEITNAFNTHQSENDNLQDSLKAMTASRDHFRDGLAMKIIEHEVIAHHNRQLSKSNRRHKIVAAITTATSLTASAAAAYFYFTPPEEHQPGLEEPERIEVSVSAPETSVKPPSWPAFYP